MHLAQGNHIFARLQRRFETGFEVARESYRNLLALAINHRRLFVTGFLGAVVASFLLVPFLGSNFFPSVDAGQITLACPPAGGHQGRGHHPADRGRSKRKSAASFRRASLPPSSTISAFPPSAINLIYNNTGIIGT